LEPPLPGLIILAALLVIDAFLASCEAALTNARRYVLREQAERGIPAARLAHDITENSTRVLATFELTRLLTHFLIGGVLVSLLSPLAGLLGRLIPALAPLDNPLVVAVELVAAGFIIYGLVELIPATLAQRSAEAWAMALARPARVVIAIFWPLAAILLRLRRSIAPPGPGEPEGGLVTEAEIMTQIDAAEEEGAIEAEEKEMLLSILELDEMVAREIMLPRIDVMALDVNTLIQEAIKVIHEAGHSRIPVYEDSLDHVVGLIYAKDLVYLNDQDIQTRSLRSLMRPAYFVPEAKKVLDLLRELRQANVHMAIIIDEFGGTAGLVTIENIVEQIVGDIRDEYDMAEESLFEKISDDEYVVDARLTLDDLNDLVNVELPSQEADTLGGYIYEKLGKVPSPGDSIDTDRLRLEVMSVTDQRIGKVRVQRTPPPADPTSAKNGSQDAAAQNRN
jgi:magnesium and cobalt exporter, CNNM family